MAGVNPNYIKLMCRYQGCRTFSRSLFSVGTQGCITPKMKKWNVHVFCIIAVVSVSGVESVRVLHFISKCSLLDDS